ncbi:MAG: hypothetical protein KDC26_13135, partial [Armatimonadetes bacterium]|nr:hypothetical protein [Armatimonadota bacterium]
QLARLLGKRRRTAVTTSTLFAGLPLALNHTEAAAAMVESVTASALTSLSLSSPCAIKLFCFMKTQTSIITTIGLLLVASSFFAGRQTAASFGEALIDQSEHQALYRQEFAEKLTALEATAPVQSVKRTVEQILDEAASGYRDGSASTSAHYMALLALNQLDPLDYEDAISHLETQRADDKVFERIGALLAGLWASVDGDAAIHWVEQNLDEKRGVAFQNVLESWSKHEPEKAYQWYQSKAVSDDSGMQLTSFRWLSKRVFLGWAESDPKGAMKALENVSVEDERGALLN